MENEKAIQRHKIFDRWYEKSRYKNSVMKIDNIIKIEIDNQNVIKLYTSFLFHINNPAYEKLRDIYNQIEKVLKEVK